MEDRNYNECSPKTPFQKNVENIINSLSLENVSNTQDHILAKFIDNVFGLLIILLKIEKFGMDIIMNQER